MILNQLVSVLRRPLRPNNHPRSEMITVKSLAANFATRELFKESSICVRDFATEKFDCKMANKLWRRLAAEVNERVVLLGEILAKQCNFYVAHRMRRANQIWNLYSRLYSEKTLKTLVSRFLDRLRSRSQKPIAFLLSAALFKWEHERITDSEVKGCIEEFEILSQKCGNTNGNCSEPTLQPDVFKAHLAEEGWEPVVENSKMFLWRRWMPESSGYEYKVFGTFYDIPARAFFSVQFQQLSSGYYIKAKFRSKRVTVSAESNRSQLARRAAMANSTDTEYRKRWDKLVIKLDIIDRETRGGCEVVHWVMQYPFPMYKRDYVYIRRAFVDDMRNVMVLMSRSTDHPACPPINECVRVTKYTSHMVIRPHRNIDEDGFDFLLSYYDDPRSSFPGPIYSWMAASGVPDFIEKLHCAAKDLHLKSSKASPPNLSGQGSTVQCAYA